MFLTLERIKKHLNIDESFTEDDEYLVHLALVAELTVQKHIDCKLDSLCDLNEDGEVDVNSLPQPLIHAMLLFVGDMYQSRESVAFSNAQAIPFNYDYILSLYKNYSNCNNS